MYKIIFQDEQIWRTLLKYAAKHATGKPGERLMGHSVDEEAVVMIVSALPEVAVIASDRVGNLGLKKLSAAVKKANPYAIFIAYSAVDTCDMPNVDVCIEKKKNMLDPLGRFLAADLKGKKLEDLKKLFPEFIYP